MFCMKCGTKIPDDAVFCYKCGARVSLEMDESTEKEEKTTQLVAAKCTNCNASLEVDSSKDAAICPFCGTAYIVSKAINNYQVSVNGNLSVQNATINVTANNNIDNILVRAKQFEEQGQFKKAVEYYNNVLDLDVNQEEAKAGLDRINKMQEEYVYFQTKTYDAGSNPGTLTLKKNALLFDKGWLDLKMSLEEITNITLEKNKVSFMYRGSKKSYLLMTQSGKFYELLCNAKAGIYPEIRKISNEDKELEQYIRKNFKGFFAKPKAVKYYMEKTGCSMEEANAYIDNLSLS